VSTLVKFEAADFETALSNARTAVADTAGRLTELKAAGPASLPTLKGALKHVTPIRTRLVEQRRITKRAIDDLAADLLKRVAEVEDPLQHAIREIEAKELNEAAARVAEAEAAEKARRDAEEAEREAERKRLAEENAKLRAELEAARAARMEEAAAKLNEMRTSVPKPDPLGLAAAMDSVAAEMDAQHEPPTPFKGHLPTIRSADPICPKCGRDRYVSGSCDSIRHGGNEHSCRECGQHWIELSALGETTNHQGTDADAINRFAEDLADWMKSQTKRFADELGAWIVDRKPYLLDDSAKEWFALNVVDVFRTVYRKCKEYK